MLELNATEAVGYLASILIVASLAMTSVVRLRSISLVGSITFVVYGALIGSIPILATNVAIAVLNVWFLRAELGHHRDLGVSVIPADAPFLADFVEFHHDELLRFQPDFVMPERDAVALLLMRDGLPAGVVVGRRDPSDATELRIVLDHVLAPYRDSRLGRWLYGRGNGVFRDLGFRTLRTTPGDATHRAYLDEVGFRREGDDYALRL